MTHPRSLLLLVIVSVMPGYLAAQGEGAWRQWTDRNGRTLRAQMIAVAGRDVVLRLENGSTSNVPLERFSDADVQYVSQWSTADVADATLRWPESVTVDAKSLNILDDEQNEAERRFVYRSGTFQFASNAPLTGTVMRQVAGDFELVRELFKQLPWAWVPQPEGGGPWFLAMLHETEEDYIAAGGSDDSSGWSKDGLIFTKFSTLGLKKVGGKYAIDARLDREGELVGLIVRLIMGDMRDLALPWSALGLEHFLEEAAYRKGSFQLANPSSGIKDLIKERASYGITSSVDDMIAMLHHTWAEDRGNDVLDIRRKNYLNGALLVYYFGYLDGDGKGTRLHRYYRAMGKDAMAYRAYLEARRSGLSTVPHPRPNSTYEDWAKDLNRHVIDQRTDEQLKAEITEKFKAAGIRF